MIMEHPGMPLIWALPVFVGMAMIGFRALVSSPATAGRPDHRPISNFPSLGPLARVLTRSPWPLVAAKIFFAAIFLLIIAAGLFGSPIAERNLATALTWTVWWTVVIITVFIVGTAWCAVCPWNSLAKWLVTRRLWRRGSETASLALRVPGFLRNLWPALILLIGLTWLELGLGVTDNPRATASLALFVLVLAVVLLAVFERNALCRYFCPVGRTIGAYAQLAPVELRPIDSDVCAKCETLDCYHGTETVEPCPTHLTMGRFAQNTYCTSCGSCALSCPADNVSWRSRPMAAEAEAGARPHWDEAWFVLGLLALTIFHGVSMLIGWQGLMGEISAFCGGPEWSLVGFTIAMIITLAVPALAFLACVGLTIRFADAGWRQFRQSFSGLAFAVLPLAFAYHIAHNLSHLVREGDGLASVFANPFGTGTGPLSLPELHLRHDSWLIPEQALFALQSGIMLWGFWMAVRILHRRGRGMFGQGRDLAGWRLFPMLVFIVAVTGFNMWLIMQGMIMRMA